MFLYRLYALITAPGVMVHEIGHLFFCLLTGVKVHRVRLFQLGKIAGYVLHDEPQRWYQAAGISFGPLIINSLMALFIFSQVDAPYWSGPAILFGWLGAAVGLHAIPSNEDAKSLLQTTNNRVWRNPFMLLGYPLVLILYLLNLLRRVHLDIVYVGWLFWFSSWYLKG